MTSGEFVIIVGSKAYSGLPGSDVGNVYSVGVSPWGENMSQGRGNKGRCLHVVFFDIT